MNAKRSRLKSRQMKQRNDTKSPRLQKSSLKFDTSVAQLYASATKSDKREKNISEDT